MYYEEKDIDGVLMYRTTPAGEWRVLKGVGEVYEQPLPEWAIAKNEGKLVAGLQLFTRNSRRMGNAFIMATKKSTWEFNGSTVDLYEVMTDMGNTFTMTERGVISSFHLGDYIMDVKEAIAARVKGKWIPINRNEELPLGDWVVKIDFDFSPYHKGRSTPEGVFVGQVSASLMGKIIEYYSIPIDQIGR